MEIIVNPDCGNAPKKVVLRDFNIAFAKGDTDSIIEMVSDEIIWKIIGDKTITGKKEMKAALNKMTNQSVRSLQLHNIITHGKEAAVYGTCKLNNGGEFTFADIYEFNSVGSKIIKKIISFVEISRSNGN